DATRRRRTLHDALARPTDAFRAIRASLALRLPRRCLFAVPSRRPNRPLRPAAECIDHRRQLCGQRRACAEEPAMRALRPFEAHTMRMKEHAIEPDSLHRLVELGIPVLLVP